MLPNIQNLDATSSCSQLQAKSASTSKYRGPKPPQVIRQGKEPIPSPNSMHILLPDHINTTHPHQLLRHNLHKNPPNLLHTPPLNPHSLQTRRPLILQPAPNNPIQPPQIRTHIQPNPMTTNIPPQMHPDGTNLPLLIKPHARILRPPSLNAIPSARVHNHTLQQVDVASRSQAVAF